MSQGNAVNQHEPNLDMLSAYVDDVLSPDAARSMGQHLRNCEVCRTALEEEAAFVGSLDSLARAEPPADFVNAVMGRVAQHPAHRPPAPVPWRSVMRWGVAASVVAAVSGAAGVRWLFTSGTLQAAEPANLLAATMGRLANLFAAGLGGTRELVSQASVLLEAGGELLWKLGSLATGSGWWVQLALLLLTVTLNYAFTRLVVNYQRRN